MSQTRQLRDGPAEENIDKWLSQSDRAARVLAIYGFVVGGLLAIPTAFLLGSAVAADKLLDLLKDFVHVGLVAYVLMTLTLSTYTWLYSNAVSRFVHTRDVSKVGKLQDVLLAHLRFWKVNAICFLIDCVLLLAIIAQRLLSSHF